MTNPFQRVLVNFASLGGAVVTWEFARHFTAPNPSGWTYQLQVSTSGGLPTYEADGTTPRTDDWYSVGSAYANVSQLTDSSQRAFGKALAVAYRVAVTVPGATYFSPPAEVLAKLSKKDWLEVREIVRKEQLRHRIVASTPGWLLKRRYVGVPCPKCLDPDTGETTLSNCTVCAGTGVQYGYYAAVPSYYSLPENTQRRQSIDMSGPGLSDPHSTTGRMLNFPQIESNDAWVAGDSDL